MIVTARCDSCGIKLRRAVYDDKPLTPCGKCGGKAIRVNLLDKRIGTQKKYIELGK